MPPDTKMPPAGFPPDASGSSRLNLLIAALAAFGAVLVAGTGVFVVSRRD